MRSMDGAAAAWDIIVSSDDHRQDRAVNMDKLNFPSFTGRREDYAQWRRLVELRVETRLARHRRAAPCPR